MLSAIISSPPVRRSHLCLLDDQLFSSLVFIFSMCMPTVNAGNGVMNMLLYIISYESLDLCFYICY